MTNQVLLWFAGYSNFTSIVIVGICFICMTIFISFVRMHVDFPGGSGAQLPLGAVQRDMVKVANPFVVKLLKHETDLKDGLHLMLSLLCDCQLVVLWGPRIQPLHDLLLQRGQDIQHASCTASGELYTQLDCLYHQQIDVHVDSSRQQKVSLPCPESVSSESLGEMPRARYPAVVFAFVPEARHGSDDPSTETVHEGGGEQAGASGDDLASRDANRIIGLLSIVHLQDEKVQKASCILSQYIKTVGVAIYSLQSLYLTGSTNNSQSMDSPVSELPSQPGAQLSNDSGLRLGNTETTNQHFSELGGAPDMSAHTTATNIRHRSTHSLRENAVFNGTPNTDDTRIERQEQISESERLFSQPSDRNSAEFTKPALPECVVCQSRPVSCVVLPCRHACVCMGCFRLLDKCPLCRGAIESYFILKDSDSSGEEESEDQEENSVLEEIQQQALHQHMGQFFENWNERLNHFLGFR